MSRAPIPGQTKTRMEAELSPEQCAQVHKAFLKDMSQMLLKVQEQREVNLYLAYTPAGTINMFDNLVPTEFKRFLQFGQDLGAKMEAALSYAAQANDQQIVIGSDLPALQPKVLIEAIDLLQKNDIVLGPSEDGGYYLCGTNEPYSFLFDDILWGQNEVLEATINKIENQADLSYDLVDTCGDIDYCSELRELKEKLEDRKKWECYPEYTAGRIEKLTMKR